MPRFYFEIADGTVLDDDEHNEGEELEGLNAARMEAVRLSGELLKHYPDRFWSCGEWSCTVRDEHKTILFVLHFYAQDAAEVAAAGV